MGGYQCQHNSAYYFPLFKRPIHLNKLSLAQLVMIYHNSCEGSFEQYLQQMIKNEVPIVCQMNQLMQEALAN